MKAFDRLLFASASFLESTIGFFLVVAAVIVGTGVGAAIRFSDSYMLVFNLCLSIAALVISAMILPAAAHGTRAMHAKLDEIIRAQDAADNRLRGVEKKTDEELERLSSECNDEGAH